VVSQFAAGAFLLISSPLSSAQIFNGSCTQLTRAHCRMFQHGGRMQAVSWADRESVAGEYLYTPISRPPLESSPQVLGRSVGAWTFNIVWFVIATILVSTAVTVCLCCNIKSSKFASANDARSMRVRSAQLSYTWPWINRPSYATVHEACLTCTRCFQTLKPQDLFLSCTYPVVL
jgi:hypothetical protein